MRLVKLREEPERRATMARILLNDVRRGMGKLGEERLYLVTDHEGFYKSCGWEFFTTVTDSEGKQPRTYTAKTI